MKCPKVLRWLCGPRNQKTKVRVTIDHLNEQRSSSLDATKRLKRESLEGVLFPEHQRQAGP